MTGLPVALDAMGGDAAPAATVAGAALAVRRWGIDVVLVGRADDLRPHLADAGADDLRVVDAPDMIAMDEDPMAGLRAKPSASIRVACQLVADGDAGAVVSAGPTGATLAAALLTMGRLPGVRRPVVAAVLPVAGGGRVVLADAGGSMDVHAEAFVGFAAMAGAYAEVLGTAAPRVGLLNVGGEPGKGNALAKAAFEELARLPSFVGNVEPPGIFGGAVDVAVSDGFTGNVFLKTVEALAGPGDAAGADRDTAAVLLGINGEVLVAHGAAGAEDVALALRTGAQIAAGGLAQQVGLRLSEQKEGA